MDWGDEWIPWMAMKDDFSMLTSTERIKLEKCAVREGVRGGMKEAEESCLSCLLI